MDLNDSGEAPEGAVRRETDIHRGLWRHWGSPAAIYGTIVYASVVAAASGAKDDQASAIRLLVFSLVSIVVFWLAHVYSTALGYHGDAGREGDRVRDSLRYALRESGGMLEAAIVPSIPLLLAALGVLPADFGVNLSLWLSVLMLALLGFSVFFVRGRSLLVCLSGAAVTGAFGVAVILLKSALQH
ncbi:hypothetical protein [Leifsonia shinshuensis]|uniref:hypothetical protein n=1 Tax=Leifsonia shinshuensis TaxID=150026 RepID=UPI0028599602|nr:hypothetical protein [Leifsonia shinshuensis]MDR6969844.1 hypothetical protein [Leifsonia shinshuensis]